MRLHALLKLTWVHEDIILTTMSKSEFERGMTGMGARRLQRRVEDKPTWP